MTKARKRAYSARVRKKVRKPPVLRLTATSRSAFATLTKAAAPPPFAFIQPNVTIPTTNLTLSPLQAGWELVGEVAWNASISYTDHSRNDQAPISGSSSVWTPIAIDFQGVVQGGTISMNLSANVRSTQTGATNKLTWSGTSTIRGLNPTKADIKARLGNVQSQVIAFKESTFAQFGADNLPVFGPPNGFGVMQLDNSPTPSARQIWDWMQNVDAGQSKFASGQQVVRQHYANLIAANPKLPALISDQLKLASYQYYNSGNNGFYWVPNAALNGWTKNSASALTAYGDDAARVEGLVNGGTPPPGWN
jgi:hypothetical protein